MENEVRQSESVARALYPWEIEEARIIFDHQLNYASVRIHENSSWTDYLDKVSRWLRQLPVSPDHNSITLGNDCFFPIKLPDRFLHVGDPNFSNIGWLLHELTHAWQFQKMGWRYLALALNVQFNEKDAGYDFGGQEGLIKRRQQGWRIHSFNVEQQAEITRTYYERLRAGEDISAWQPFLHDLQQKV